MFEVAWSELLLVAIVAILVVGPKELPALLRTVGRMIGKLRRSADEFRRHFDEAVREAGAEDLQREMRALRSHNPLTQIRDSIEDATRDPFKSAPADSPATPAAEDDLGPPPPLPPRNNGPSASTPPDLAPPAPVGAAGVPPETSDSPPAAKENGGNGVAPDQRLNGEHRPAN